MKPVAIHLVLCLLSIAALIGCSGPEASVQGSVTIDGQLARQGTVQFHPVDGGPTAYGSIAKDGTYSLRVGQGDLSDPNAGEIQPGAYVVTVVVNMPSRKDAASEAEPPKPGARLTAEKYANEETSELRVTVAAGRNVIPLELEGSAADEDESEVESAASDVQTEPGTDVGEQGAVSPPDESTDESVPTPPTESAPSTSPEEGTPPELDEPGKNAEEQTP